MKRQVHERHTIFYELWDAMAEQGCFICRLKDRSEKRYLDSVLYEYVNDAGFREKISASYGFSSTSTTTKTGSRLGRKAMHGFGF